MNLGDTIIIITHCNEINVVADFFIFLRPSVIILIFIMLILSDSFLWST